MMWWHVPKGVFVGSEVLQLGVYYALFHFNIGSQAVIKLFETLGTPPGEFCLIECQQSDDNRVSKAEYKSQEKNKTRKLQREKEERKITKAKKKKGKLILLVHFNWNYATLHKKSTKETTTKTATCRCG